MHEHSSPGALMEELRVACMSEGAWPERFKTLGHQYEHHMGAEETEVFWRAREVVPRMRLRVMVNVFLKENKKNTV